MCSNLAQRGCPLLSCLDFPTLHAHQLRFLRLGVDEVSIADMNTIYNTHIDAIDKMRIEVSSESTHDFLCPSSATGAL